LSKEDKREQEEQEEERRGEKETGGKKKYTRVQRIKIQRHNSEHKSVVEPFSGDDEGMSRDEVQLEFINGETRELHDGVGLEPREVREGPRRGKERRKEKLRERKEKGRREEGGGEMYRGYSQS
jgi:hypothetical protein